MMPAPPISPLFPYATIFRSDRKTEHERERAAETVDIAQPRRLDARHLDLPVHAQRREDQGAARRAAAAGDRKSTRVNSSHQINSNAAVCLEKKTPQEYTLHT